MASHAQETAAERALRTAREQGLFAALTPARLEQLSRLAAAGTKSPQQLAPALTNGRQDATQTSLAA